MTMTKKIRFALNLPGFKYPINPDERDVSKWILEPYNAHGQRALGLLFDLGPFAGTRDDPMTSVKFNKQMNGRPGPSQLQIEAIAKLTGCSAYALETFDLGAFQSNPFGTALTWSKLLMQASRAGFVEHDDIPRAAIQMRDFSINGQRVSVGQRNLTKIERERPFRLVIPTNVDGMDMAGWQSLVFAFGKNAWLNFLPRHANARFGPETVPKGVERIIYPEAPGVLKTNGDTEQIERFAFVFHSHGFTSELISDVICPDCTPEQMDAHLGALASWLGGQDPQTYRVVLHEYELI